MVFTPSTEMKCGRVMRVTRNVATIRLVAYLVFVATVLISLPIGVCFASSSAGVTVSGNPPGFIGPPTNFTLTKLDSNRVEITWVEGINADNTMIRRSTGGYPEDETDGTQVYYGSGEEYTEENLDLDRIVYYYRAWGEKSSIYSDEYAEGSIGGGVLLFIGMVALALGVSFVAMRAKFIVFSMIASLAWLALGMLTMTSPSTIGLDAISSGWVTVLGFVFILATIGPLLIQMRTDIRHEAKVRGKTVSWTTFGRPPKEEVEPRSVKIKRERREQLKRLSGRGK